MKKILFLTIAAFFSTTLSAQTSRIWTVDLENDWNQEQAEAPVVIDLHQLNPGFRVRSAVITDGRQEIPSQLDDLDGDLKADELAFVIPMPANSKKTIRITLSAEATDRQYPARVFAQLLAREAVNQKHAPVQSITVPGTTNFYSMVHGHGPMFESELVGYRIYFNEKQTIDPYGKFQKRLELKDTQFYPTKQQQAEGYGDDVLLVGNSCGIGALKGWNGVKATHIEPIAFRTERLLAAGPIRTVAEVEVKGWKYQDKELTMKHRYILYAGHRDLRIETSFDEPLDNEVFCTGVMKVKGNETISYSDHRGVIGSWGRYWPVNDTINYSKETIGIGTYIPTKYIKAEAEDADNYLYLIGNKGKTELIHHTVFTSRKETFGFPTSETWFSYLQNWKEELEHPIKVRINKK